RGSIDLSPKHNYSGTLDIWTDNLHDYVAAVGVPPKKNVGAVPAELQATGDSSQWGDRGVSPLPKSSPTRFSSNFSPPIGTTWSAFEISPLKVSLDFPAVFLAAVPQLFHSDILQDGILSGKISLSGTLRNPRIVGEAQLVNGKLAGSSDSLLNILAASS